MFAWSVLCVVYGIYKEKTEQKETYVRDAQKTNWK